MGKKTGLLSVSWNNHSLAVINNINNFLQRECYCDATIICDNKHIKVHRIILSTCSDYFREIFDNIRCTHPFIILKDIDFIEFETLVDFMYKGKVNVYENRLANLIKAADSLKIKGLAVSDDDLTSPIKITSQVNDESNLPKTPPTVSSESMPTPLAILKDQHKDTEEGRNKRKNDCDSPNKHSSHLIKSKKHKGSPLSPKNVFKSPQKVAYKNPSKVAYKKVSTILQEKSTAKSQNRNIATVSNMCMKGYKNISENEPVVVLNKNLQSTDTNQRELTLDQENTATENQDADWVSENDDTLSFSLNTSLDSHAKNSDSPILGKQYPHPCPDCSYCAKCPTDLMAHMKIHAMNPKPLKPFKRDHCSYETQKKVLLENHMKSHNVEKPFKCKRCPFRTSLNISLKKHEEKFCKGKLVKLRSSLYEKVQTTLNQDPPGKSSQYHLEISGDIPFQGHLESASGTHSFKEKANKSVSSSQSHLDRSGNSNRHLNRSAGDIPPQGLLEEDYFLCAFCPHKTTKESLLASHVAENHKTS